MKQTREKISSAKRVVVKVGTRVLVDSTGRPDPERIRVLVDGLAAGHAEHREMILVSSGAIAAGVEALGMKVRPAALPDLQMAAAVGQVRLMNLYTGFFAEKNITVGQVLLTDAIFRAAAGSENAKNTLHNLLAHRIVPVINENDAVSTAEITFGDNDILASLVATLVKADVLILLSITDGLRDDAGNRVPVIEQISDDILALDKGKSENLSAGGMKSKLMSAGKAAAANIPVIIADGRIPGIIQTILSGGDTGTLIVHREPYPQVKEYVKAMK
ncbi:MAG: glutamate 5-kinase [Kiritimatiellales bacterium]